MRYQKTIQIDNNKIEYIKNLINKEPSSEKECFGENQKHIVSVVFENKYKMYIDVYGCKFEENGKNTAWLQAVLYDENNIELKSSSPEIYYSNEWIIDYNGDEYIINIMIKKED